MTYKILHSKTGFDALTETNPNNLNFSSDYPTLRYSESGMVNMSSSYTFTAAGSYSGQLSSTTTFQNPLLYKPLIFFMSNYNYSWTDTSGVFGNGSEYVTGLSFRGSAPFSVYMTAQWDNLTLYLTGYWTANPTSSDTYPFTQSITYNAKYFIFQNDTGL